MESYVRGKDSPHPTTQQTRQVAAMAARVNPKLYNGQEKLGSVFGTDAGSVADSTIAGSSYIDRDKSSSSEQEGDDSEEDLNGDADDDPTLDQSQPFLQNDQKMVPKALYDNQFQNGRQASPHARTGNVQVPQALNKAHLLVLH